MADAIPRADPGSGPDTAPAGPLRRAGETALRLLDLAAAHPGRTVAAILLAALGVRLLAIALSGGYVPFSDAADYDRHARSIAAGDGFPQTTAVIHGGETALRPPVYPTLLGLTYLVFGESIDVGRVLGAVLGTVTVAGVMLLSHELWGRRLAVAAGIVAAAFPPLILMSVALLTEGAFVPLVVFAVWAGIRCARAAGREALLWAALVGVLCGVAMLTRTNGTLMPIILAAGLTLGAAAVPWPRRLAVPAVILLVTVLTLVPWTIRNANAFGEFVPTSTQTGYGPAGLFNDEAMERGGHRAVWVVPVTSERYRDLYLDPELNEARVDQLARERAFEYMADHPGYVLEASWLGLLRALELQTVPDLEGPDRKLLGLNNFTGPLVKYSWFLGALLSIVGIVRLRRLPPGNRGPAWMWITPLALFLVGIWVIGLARYRAPLYPFMAPLIALALIDLLERASGRRLELGPGRAEPRG